MKYKKTVNDLEKVAVKWWPKELEEEVDKKSVIPKLLATHEQFISILKLAGDTPDQIFSLIESSRMAPNLFLKHLVVVSDYGGELIKRLGNEFEETFSKTLPNGQYQMTFMFNGSNSTYHFKSFPLNGLSNSKLKIDGNALVKNHPLTDELKDMIMILLYGGASTTSDKGSLERCDLGGILGNADEIEKYVRQKYIHVSRITTGANTNSIGQIAQVYVTDYLKSRLDNSYQVKSNGKVKLRSYDNENGMPFDVVVRRSNKIVGIEVSFQVTSNSVIERKAALAEDRHVQMRREGYFVAYVIDGAGNFSRQSALTTLCQSSDCTVAYSDSELDTLIDFIRGKLDDPIR
jgi:hypothetical protein